MGYDPVLQNDLLVMMEEKLYKSLIYLTRIQPWFDLKIALHKQSGQTQGFVIVSMCVPLPVGQLNFPRQGVD
jgi:hypothetical protein